MTRRSSRPLAADDVPVGLAPPAGPNPNAFVTIYPVASAEIAGAPIGFPIMGEGFITETGPLPSSLAAPNKL